MLMASLMLLTSACSGVDAGKKSPDELAAPYLVALEEIITADAALNVDMEYISLVINEGVPLEKVDQQVIEEYLQNKYSLNIYNYTYEQLLEQKLSKPGNTKLKGILVTIEKQSQPNNNKMIIEVSKYRANEGAIGMELILSYQQGRWEIVDYGQMRAS